MGGGRGSKCPLAFREGATDLGHIYTCQRPANLFSAGSRLGRLPRTLGNPSSGVSLNSWAHFPVDTGDSEERRLEGPVGSNKD